MQNRTKLTLAALWHALAIILLMALASLRLHAPFWLARREEFVATSGLISAYAIVALVCLVWIARKGTASWRVLACTTASAFAATFLFFLAIDENAAFSRALLLLLVAAAAFLLLASLLLQTARWMRAGLALVAVAALAASALALYRT